MRLTTHCHLGLVRGTPANWQAARGPGASLTTATTMYREMGMTYWLEKAEAEVRELG